MYIILMILLSINNKKMAQNILRAICDKTSTILIGYYENLFKKL